LDNGNLIITNELVLFSSLNNNYEMSYLHKIFLMCVFTTLIITFSDLSLIIPFIKDY